jgi:SAM-dependent methyltransferase
MAEGSSRPGAGRIMSLRFAATLLVSATLLFACQPMIARMTVPLLGGAPAVWIICSLCFQGLLLAGYAYAHLVAARFTPRVQVGLQLVLVAAALAVMPIAVDPAWARTLTEREPALGLVVLILRVVGLPFFVLSTTSPLLQRWFADLGERDPYYLYVASNAGSMLALLGYPLVIDPLLGIGGQSRALQIGYVAYGVMVLACGVSAARASGAARFELTRPVSVPDAPPGERGARRRERLIWVALAFAPSSLLLGATEHITTDVASVPLLWVLPLTLYLASFMVTFARRPPLALGKVARALALVACLVAIMLIGELLEPAWVIVAAHLLLLFLGAVVCHGALAAKRPPASRLTEFYLLLSVGGVLGGIFNGLVAPFVFSGRAEYPVAIALACAGRAFASGTDAAKEPRESLARGILYGLALGLGTFVVARLGASLQLEPKLMVAVAFGVPVLVSFAWANRPVRFAVALGAVLLAGTTHGTRGGVTLHQERSFFGVLRVTEDHTERFRLLVFGDTMHGQESVLPSRRSIPLAYYHATGPAGDVLGPLPRAFAGDPGDESAGDEPALPPRRVGVVGLGVGALAAYARPGDTWTFFEINGGVVSVARRWFTFLGAVPEGAQVSVEVGDGRLLLRDGDADRFDVLVLDAFSSDAIPVHLVTREALQIYRRALAPGGVLLAHVSNRHVKLQPIFAALAAETDLVAIGREDLALTPALEAEGKSPSEWVVLTSSARAISRITGRSPGWTALHADPSRRVWTDDYANVLGALRF